MDSIKARLDHVTYWLEANSPDVLLVQELKGLEFPSEIFEQLGHESASVTQKSYNGVAVLPRRPMKVLATTLHGEWQMKDGGTGQSAVQQFYSLAAYGV